MAMLKIKLFVRLGRWQEISNGRALHKQSRLHLWHKESKAPNIFE